MLSVVGALGVLLERAVDRGLERHAPGAGLGRGATCAGLAGVGVVPGGGAEREDGRRKPGDLGGVAQVEREGLGGVERVVGELRRELGEARRDFEEALARGAVEPDAGVARVADRGLDHAAAALVERRPRGAAPQGEQGVVERAALGDAEREADDVRLQLALDRAPVVGVADAEHVADEVPRAGEGLECVGERGDAAVPGRLAPRLERGDLRLGLGDEDGQRLARGLGRQPVEAREALPRKEGVLGHGGDSRGTAPPLQPRAARRIRLAAHRDSARMESEGNARP